MTLVETDVAPVSHPTPGFERGFAWALGIEDTFVPQAHSRSGRVLDEYVLTQHDRFWREDLRMIADIGVRDLRYGVPWYQVNPAPGQFDWSWTDQVLPYMVEDLGIDPILDLIHYGAPLWLEGTFLAPDYPERVAEFATALAERYGHLFRRWTPLNEPRVHAYFSGRAGLWPPYRRGSRGYAQVLVALARGMARTVDAIRSVRPDAVMVHVDATSVVETADPALEAAVAHRLEQPFVAFDLVEGRLGPDHVMWPWLLAQGVPAPWLEELAGGHRRLDVFGGNYYPQMSVWVVEGTPDRPTRRRRRGNAHDLETAMRGAAARTGRPVMLTETSMYGPLWSRARWLQESVRAVERMRADGVPLLGYTWFPAFSLLAWSYRGGRRPTDAYISHMGFWDLRDDGSGTLLRHANGLERRYADLIAAEG